MKDFQKRYLLKISYVGTNYSGWQIQSNASSIQGSIMHCLKFLLNNEISLIVGAGRTDAGVHAINFFAHFDYLHELDCDHLSYKLNRFLSPDISIHYVRPISNNFHARFSAISRRYEYWISNFKDPFLYKRSYFLYNNIDFQKINDGAKIFIGTHNFSNFSKTKCSNNICIVHSTSWIQKKEVLVFSITANRFLHNMVRSIVGSLIYLGLNKITLTDLESYLNNENNCKFTYSVPACGLHLVNVKYPKKYSIEDN
ncbi:MAG: tRNA pseudouridine(38-40) synthase TruA [Flavobacteriales bacterium]|nr:tRNA pseudouridine(38-40) synthase TruA [Flavobacteriales bacterium]|tara:strand:- start:34504 stop:35268 length:765 start_codon:yes stop_codon:yes gene_type:complete